MAAQDEQLTSVGRKLTKSLSEAINRRREYMIDDNVVPSDET